MSNVYKTSQKFLNTYNNAEIILIHRDIVIDHDEIVRRIFDKPENKAKDAEPVDAADQAVNFLEIEDAVCPAPFADFEDDIDMFDDN